MFENRSPSEAPSRFTDFSVSSCQPKSRASLNLGLQCVAAELHHACHSVGQ